MGVEEEGGFQRETSATSATTHMLYKVKKYISVMCLHGHVCISFICHMNCVSGLV